MCTFPLYFSIFLAAFRTGRTNLHSFSVALLYSLSAKTPSGRFLLFFRTWITSVFSLNFTFTGRFLCGLYFPNRSTLSIDVLLALVIFSSSVSPSTIFARVLTTCFFTSSLSSYSDSRIPWNIMFFSSSWFSIRLSLSSIFFCFSSFTLNFLSIRSLVS